MKTGFNLHRGTTRVNLVVGWESFWKFQPKAGAPAHTKTHHVWWFGCGDRKKSRGENLDELKIGHHRTGCTVVLTSVREWETPFKQTICFRFCSEYGNLAEFAEPNRLNFFEWLRGWNTYQTGFPRQFQPQTVDHLIRKFIMRESETHFSRTGSSGFCWEHIPLLSLRETPPEWILV